MTAASVAPVRVRCPAGSDPGRLKRIEPRQEPNGKGKR